MHNFVQISEGSVKTNIAEGVNNDFSLKKSWNIHFAIAEHDEFT